MRLNHPSTAVVLSAAMTLISSLRCASEKIIAQSSAQVSMDGSKHSHTRHAMLSADEKKMDEQLEGFLGKDNVPCCHNPFEQLVVEQGASREVAICVPGRPMMDPEKLRQEAILKVIDLVCQGRRICQFVLKKAEVAPDGKSACAVVDTTETLKS